MSDPTRPDAPGAPTEEQARQYAEQLRSAPAAQLVTEVLSSLLNVAQIKLGRRDGRLLIDLSSVVLEHARRHLPGELTGQVDQALSQLRLAQVQAEGAAAGGGQAEPNDLAESPGPPAGAGPAGSQPAASPPAQPPPASRLWVPGRDF